MFDRAWLCNDLSIINTIYQNTIYACMKGVYLWSVTGRKGATMTDSWSLVSPTPINNGPTLLLLLLYSTDPIKHFFLKFDKRWHSRQKKNACVEIAPHCAIEQGARSKEPAHCCCIVVLCIYMYRKVNANSNILRMCNHTCRWDMCSYSGVATRTHSSPWRWESRAFSTLSQRGEVKRWPSQWCWST